MIQKGKPGRPTGRPSKRENTYTIVHVPPVTHRGITVHDLYRKGAVLPDFKMLLQDGCIPEGTTLERDGRRFVVRKREVVEL